MTKKLLSDMQVGERAFIDYIEPSYLKRRLQDLGMYKGNSIVCIMCSPTKSPIAYQIQDAVVAIRFEDAHKVHIYD